MAREEWTQKGVREATATAQEQEQNPFKEGRPPLIWSWEGEVLKQCPPNMLVAMAEGAKQQTHLSAPAASPRELQVGFKGFPAGMGRGAAALEGTLAKPAEALELRSTATPHACFFLWPPPEEATR